MSQLEALSGGTDELEGGSTTTDSSDAECQARAKRGLRGKILAANRVIDELQRRLEKVGDRRQLATKVLGLLAGVREALETYVLAHGTAGEGSGRLHRQLRQRITRMRNKEEKAERGEARTVTSPKKICCYYPLIFFNITGSIRLTL